MKSFLLYNGKSPTLKWGSIPDEHYFEGTVPEGYGLAICPNAPYIIIDIDKHGNIDGFDNIPRELVNELHKSLNYRTKNDGMHIWIKYTGTQHLMNKTSGFGIDLRTNRGYVRWYLDKDIRSYIHLVNDSSKELNKWLEKLFS